MSTLIIYVQTWRFLEFFKFCPKPKTSKCAEISLKNIFYFKSLRIKRLNIQFFCTFLAKKVQNSDFAFFSKNSVLWFWVLKFCPKLFLVDEFWVLTFGPKPAMSSYVVHTCPECSRLCQNCHTSKINGLCSIINSKKTLQTLLYFMYKKTHVVFFVFHIVQLYIFTL